jgi:hypothetical protein
VSIESIVKNKMKKLLLIFLLAIGSASYGQSKLPPCQGTGSGKWTMCQGTYIYNNGNEYIGEWKDGQRYGQGTITLRSGTKYVGNFQDDKLHGYGTLRYDDGSEYVGEFKDNKYHGHGTLRRPNGELFSGDFKNGQFDGQGNFVSSSGDKYTGEYKNGLPNGEGIEILTSGEKYIGVFHDGERNGQGTLIFPDGRKYTGKFNNGVLSTVATTTPSGRKTSKVVTDADYSDSGTYTPVQVRSIVKQVGGIENLLKEVAKNTLKNLPLKVDNELEIISVFALNTSLNYQAKLVLIQKIEIENISELRNRMYNAAVRRMCTLPISSVAITEFDAVYKYTVFDKSDIFILTYEIDKKKCLTLKH